MTKAKGGARVNAEDAPATLRAARRLMLMPRLVARESCGAYLPRRGRETASVQRTLRRRFRHAATRPPQASNVHVPGSGTTVSTNEPGVANVLISLPTP